MTAVLEVATDVYGDIYFVNKGEVAKHSFLTSVILSILLQLDEEDLRTPCSHEDTSGKLLIGDRSHRLH